MIRSALKTIGVLAPNSRSRSVAGNQNYPNRLFDLRKSHITSARVHTQLLPKLSIERQLLTGSKAFATKRRIKSIDSETITGLIEDVWSVSQITAYYKKIRGDSLVRDKKVKDLTVEDVISWGRQMGRLTKLDEAELINNHASGESLLSLRENVVLSSTLKHKLDRLMQPINEGVAWQPLPTDLTDKEIKKNVRKIVNHIGAIMEYSKDLAYQQKHISPLIKSPLPLDSDGTTWCPYYFDDVNENTSVDFHALKEAIKRTTNASAQNKKLISMVQMSGVGKTHMAITYARKEGGILINFNDGYHRPILDLASNFIAAQQRLVKPLEHKEDDEESYNKEVHYRDRAVQVMKLIQLTFLEFAKYFFEEAGQPTRIFAAKEKQTAFIRATLSSAKPLIFNMFVQNLKYISSTEAFAEFELKMFKVAQRHHLKTIFFDEANRGESYLVGHFIHHAPKENRVVLMKQMKEEQNLTAASGDNVLFSRPTSIVYLLVLAMEDLTKRFNYSHVMLSTSWKLSRMLPPLDVPRGRLGTDVVILNDTAEQIVERFKKVAAKAFGDPMEKLLNEQKHILKRLGGRSLYLFSPFEELIPKGKMQLAKFVDEWLSKAEAMAMEKAQYYIDNGGILTGNIGDKNKLEFLAQFKQYVAHVALGSENTELSALASQYLLESGLVKLKKRHHANPNEFASIDTLINKTNKEPDMDYYVQLQFKKLPYSTLLEYFRLVYSAHRDKGVIGEYFVALILKWASELRKTLDDLIPFDELSDTFKKLKLEENIVVMHKSDYDFKFQHQIFQPGNSVPFNFKPTSMLGPDFIVRLTFQQRMVGFMVIQAKNWNHSVDDKFLEQALPVLNPTNFYHGGRNVAAARKDWKDSNYANVLNFVWVRAIYAQGFTQKIWRTLRLWNSSLEGAKYPILLLTPKIVLSSPLFQEVEGQFEDLGLGRTAGAFKNENLDEILTPEERQELEQELPKLRIDYKIR